ncbi:MAG: HPF/RaiA family ribosome-associated protein [Phycisphaerales bacterium]|nr:HPF/RaiA family ribosome-associated protein [Phycisphaerales bacterium]
MATNVSIQIKPGNLHTSEAIERRVYDKLAGVCTRFGAVMTAVEVHFEDVNGPKHGGDDLRCGMEARVNGRDPVAVNARAPDLYAAIDLAARRLEAAVARVLDRKEARERRRFRSSREHDAGR